MFALLVAVLLAVPACGGRHASPFVGALDDDAITVASFDFDESAVVAEVYSQRLEAAGYRVRRAFRLGPREFVGPALMSGLVEFVPEYAGTAAEFHSLGRAARTSDVVAAHAELVRAVVSQHVAVLSAAPAQDANTFVVTPATADRLHLGSISDLRAVAQQLTFGGPAECATRRLCLVGLADTYGVTFRNVLSLDTGGPITLQALEQGLVDVALLFTTDPAIVRHGLVELRDDRGLQPAENVTPVVRTEVVDRWGAGLVALIDDVSAHLSTDAVRSLNDEARRPDADIAAVAATWWSENAS